VGKLFLLFTLLPLVDLWVLLAIGRTLGPWPTVALVVLTGIGGAWLAKREGRRVVDGWRRALTEGRVPDEGLLSGALVLAGGLLLVSPGLITDVIGLPLLFPPTRRLAAAALRRFLAAKVRSGQVRLVTFGHGPWRRDGAPGEPGEIDVTPPRARPDET
jgi:UPF0716 protein FxsA